MAFAVGAIVGPLLASQAMKYLGNDVLFQLLSILEGTLLVFILYRMHARRSLAVDDQESYVLHSFIPSTTVDLDPRSEHQGADTEIPEIQAARMVIDHAPNAAVSLARSISSSKPELTLEIAEAMAQAAPDRVANWFEIATEDNDNIAEMMVNIALAAPENSSEIIINAAEMILEEDDDNAEESVLELVESFASGQSDVMQDLRPVDREDDYSEEDMADVYGKLAELVPEQAGDMAISMTEAMPDASVEITQAYVSAVSEQENGADEDADEVWPEEATEALVEHVSLIAESLPEHAVDVASAVVESIPEAATDVVDVLQSNDQITEELATNIEEYSASVSDVDNELGEDKKPKT